MLKGELLTIETDDFSLVIKGPLPSPHSFALRDFVGGRREPLRPRDAEHLAFHVGSTPYPLLRVECVSPRFSPNRVRVQSGSIFEAEDGERFLPLFFEHVDYQVLLSNANGRRFQLQHAYPSIAANLTVFDDHSHTTAGTFNFAANVGQSSFQIVEDGKTHLVISFVVFSSKIDFLHDRHAMLRDLSRVHNALMFQLFRPTSSAGASTSGAGLGLEWLVNFHGLSREIIKTAQRIERKAHNQIVTQDEITATRKIKRPNKSLMRQMTTRGKAEVLARRSVTVERRRLQVNTPENRYLKFLMRRLVTVGGKWVAHARTLPSWGAARSDEEDAAKANAHKLLDDIAADLTRLERGLKGKFWTEVGEELPSLLNKTTFLFHDLFLRFEKLYKTVNRGVTLHQRGTRTIYTLSMEKLYEVWTYLKLTQIASTLVNGAENPVLPKIEADAFQAILKTGEGARIAISDTVSICAQRTFRRYTPALPDLYFSPLVAQEPDLVFEVQSGGVINLLDAKYRVNVATRRGGKLLALNSAGLIAEDLAGAAVLMSPKDDDINAMHRYKDAIRYRQSPSDADTADAHRATHIGVILYPRKPAAVEKASIERNLDLLQRFEIGAVPLSPGEPDAEWPEKYASHEWAPDSSQTEQVRIFAFIVAAMLQGSSSQP
jgi:hypothetical protein